MYVAPVSRPIFNAYAVSRPKTRLENESCYLRQPNKMADLDSLFVSVEVNLLNTFDFTNKY